ncbi:MAG: sporulation regulator WhiA [Bacillales bacterium]|jgi:DNA-binding protein WhiA|nr:sporulation regulator WhiA [Bacillales bacterium]
MSFASETKKELTSLETKPCCNKAELSALIRMNGSLSFSQKRVFIDVQTENAAIARRIYSLLKSLYQANVELLVRKKMKLKKNNVYIVRLVERAQEILSELCILKDGFTFIHEIDPKLIKKDCCKRAYLRGAFLAGGSVNNPETSSYHLEILSMYEDHTKSLYELMEEYELNSKILERKKGFINYIKGAEKISDFLTVVEAYHAVMHFEDVRIIRDLRNSSNRVANCDQANIDKIVASASRVREKIKFIDERIGINALPERLQEVARLRYENEDIALKELCEMMETETLSKSGFNHRLKKIEEIADNLAAGNLSL